MQFHCTLLVTFVTLVWAAASVAADAGGAGDRGQNHRGIGWSTDRWKWDPDNSDAQHDRDVYGSKRSHGREVCNGVTKIVTRWSVKIQTKWRTHKATRTVTTTTTVPVTTTEQNTKTTTVTKRINDPLTKHQSITLTVWKERASIATKTKTSTKTKYVYVPRTTVVSTKTITLRSTKISTTRLTVPTTVLITRVISETRRFATDSAITMTTTSTQMRSEEATMIVPVTDPSPATVTLSQTIIFTAPPTNNATTATVYDPANCSTRVTNQSTTLETVTYTVTKSVQMPVSTTEVLTTVTASAEYNDTSLLPSAETSLASSIDTETQVQMKTTTESEINATTLPNTFTPVVEITSSSIESNSVTTISDIPTWTSISTSTIEQDDLPISTPTPSSHTSTSPSPSPSLCPHSPTPLNTTFDPPSPNPFTVLTIPPFSTLSLSTTTPLHPTHSGPYNLRFRLFSNAPTFGAFEVATKLGPLCPENEYKLTAFVRVPTPVAGGKQARCSIAVMLVRREASGPWGTPEVVVGKRLLEENGVWRAVEGLLTGGGAEETQVQLVWRVECEGGGVDRLVFLDDVSVSLVTV
ncbi:hypothetical protein BDZ91DRAFT_846180 [Kalaharituber pfeilii]|nr:hypothetical protein BDZ91DRAFT_846180 [Kalaharituber pfeilii]